MKKLIYGLALVFYIGLANAQAPAIIPNQSAMFMAQTIVGEQGLVINAVSTIDTPYSSIYTGDLGIGLNAGRGAVFCSSPPSLLDIYATTGIGPYIINPSAPFELLSDSDFLALPQSIDYPLYNTSFPDYSVQALYIDFIPYVDTLTFRYVYASAHMKNYPCYPSQYFMGFCGIFLSGGEYATPQNLALVPGTNVSVSSNSINSSTSYFGSFYSADEICPLLCTGCAYHQYYVENTDYISNSSYPFFVPYSFSAVKLVGYTTPLSAKASVTPCDTYHLKIGFVAVNEPPVLFIEPMSYSAPLMLPSVVAQSSPELAAASVAQACRSCAPAGFILQRNSDSLEQTLSYSLSGNAISGIDYEPLPGSVTFAVGVDSVIVPVQAFPNPEATTNRTLSMHVQGDYASCNSVPNLTDSIIILSDTTTAIQEAIAPLYGVKLQPNPFQSSLSLAVPTAMQHDEWSLKLVDIMGRTVLSSQGNVQVINASLIGISALSKGIYVAHVEHQKTGRRMVEKVVRE